MSEREEKFEKMLTSVQNQYTDTMEKMKILKAKGKEKTESRMAYQKTVTKPKGRAD